jgi:hypothetical protein
MGLANSAHKTESGPLSTVVQSFGKSKLNPGGYEPGPHWISDPIMTMGVFVASLVAWVGGVPNLAMRATGRRTSSAEIHASRSDRGQSPRVAR